MGFSAVPRYHIAWLFLPRQIVMVRDAPTAISTGPLSGITRGRLLDFDSVVVSIKKVISKNARSTSAVRSTRTGNLLVCLAPDFPGERVSSAMMLSLRLNNWKQAICSTDH